MYLGLSRYSLHQRANRTMIRAVGLDNPYRKVLFDLVVFLQENSLAEAQWALRPLHSIIYIFSLKEAN